MLRIMYPRYPLQIYGSFPIHLSEKSSYPEDILSSPADLFGIIPLKRRLSSHWIWNARPLEARDLLICGIINLSLRLFSNHAGNYLPSQDRSLPYGQVATCPLPPCQLRIIYPALSFGRFKDLFRSIPGRNHDILKIFLPAR